MSQLSPRVLLALALMVSPLVMPGAAADAFPLYAHATAHLLAKREQLKSLCANKSSEACRAIQALDGALRGLTALNDQCHEGNTVACQKLAIGSQAQLTDASCEEGNANACTQLRTFHKLAPACGAGDESACHQIESALFGSETPQRAQPPG